MDASTTDPAAAVADDYSVDDAPLSQAEHDMLLKMEGVDPPVPIPPSVSPSRKKRKRANSASPHLTPSRLRASVKVTARAMDAGYKPNSSHSFRQEQNPDATIPFPPTGAAIADGSDRGMLQTLALEADSFLTYLINVARPSESAEPDSQHVAQPIGICEPNHRGSSLGWAPDHGKFCNAISLNNL